MSGKEILLYYCLTKYFPHDKVYYYDAGIVVADVHDQ
jgi:lipopolysaccharide biosynthesis glycosyltransferase